LNSTLKDIELSDKIFSVNEDNFEALALEIFRFQYSNNPLYNQYCRSMQVNEDKVNEIKKIPFLPISFFKTHRINTTTFEPQAVFESSGTTSTINSRHFVKDTTIYERSFSNTFQLFYGNVQDWCIIALLPSYLERKSSSLVMMAQKLIERSSNPLSGFYLYEYEKEE
jgi:hypothetical protein